MLADGFNGKTLSFLINNFAARVCLEASQQKTVELVPHPQLDSNLFDGLDGLHLATNVKVQRLNLVKAA